MPWRFVEMYGRTQFSDIVVFQALEENNRALRLLAPGTDTLTVVTAQALALSVRRLLAAWELHRSAVPAATIAAAEARLEGVDGLLSPVLMAESASHALHRLAQRVERDAVRAAVATLEAGVARLVDRRVPLQSLTQLSVAFQAESAAWQQMPVPGTRESDVLDGFERCYGLGRDIGWRQVAGEAGETFAEWRRFAEMSFHQLDSIRVALSAENRATRWCLGRLIDAFCKHESLLAVRRCLADVALSSHERILVEAELESSLDESRARAQKLVPHTYAVEPGTFRERVTRDVERFALGHQQPLPRSA
jgi:hypothetical protein